MPREAQRFPVEEDVSGGEKHPGGQHISAESFVDAGEYFRWPESAACLVAHLEPLFEKDREHRSGHAMACCVGHVKRDQSIVEL